MASTWRSEAKIKQVYERETIALLCHAHLTLGQRKVHLEGSFVLIAITVPWTAGCILCWSHGQLAALHWLPVLSMQQPPSSLGR